MRCCRWGRTSGRFRSDVCNHGRHGRARPGHPRPALLLKTWMPGTRPGMTSLGGYDWCVSCLPRSSRVLEDRAEQLPALAVELHHLELLVHPIVGGRGVVEDARQRQVELNVLQVSGLLHHVLAGEIVAALFEDMDQ